jgi:hypothetical protein
MPRMIVVCHHPPPNFPRAPLFRHLTLGLFMPPTITAGETGWTSPFSQSGTLCSRPSYNQASTARQALAIAVSSSCIWDAPPSPTIHNCCELWALENAYGKPRPSTRTLNGKRNLLSPQDTKRSSAILETTNRVPPCYQHRSASFAGFPPLVDTSVNGFPNGIRGSAKNHRL